MANLKKLIHGQDVRFDTHQAGDAQPTNWHHVHLEKVLHEGGKIRFPLAGDFQPSWSSRVNDVQYERVKREVARELGRVWRDGQGGERTRPARPIGRQGRAFLLP